MNLERLTNKILTKARNDPWDYCGLDSFCTRDCFKPTPCELPKVIDRLAEIEDILGDDYDLDHLRELVEADRNGKSVANCKHVFVYDEVRSRTVCQKCGYVLTAEDKQRICKEGLELLEAEEREAAEAALKGERDG